MLSLPARTLTTLACLSALAVSGCRAPGDTPDDKRAFVDNEATETLDKLFAENEDAKQIIADASGYAVFSNISIDVLFVGGGGGYGVVVPGSGDRHYMRMAEGGVGLGIGGKDFRVVFVFHNDEVMNDFVQSGWDFKGEADAAAAAGDVGGAASVEGNVKENVTIFQLTETGLAARASLKGTRYWTDDTLN